MKPKSILDNVMPPLHGGLGQQSGLDGIARCKSGVKGLGLRSKLSLYSVVMLHARDMLSAMPLETSPSGRANARCCVKWRRPLPSKAWGFQTYEIAIDQRRSTQMSLGS